jgi:hypothetical protein
MRIEYPKTALDTKVRGATSTGCRWAKQIEKIVSQLDCVTAAAL